MSRFFCWFVKITAWIPYLLLYRPKYYYQDKKAQSRKIRGKGIVMPNHQSIWDFAGMMYTFPSRNLRCVVAEVMYANGKMMTAFLNLLGAIKVDRYGGDFTFLEKSNKILKSNGVVEIYPESRLPKKGEEKPLPFKSSVALMALEADAPIIPVVTNGKYNKKQRLRILIGKPIDINELYDDSLDEKLALQLATDKLRDIIKEMNNELESKTRKTKEKKESK